MPITVNEARPAATSSPSAERQRKTFANARQPATPAASNSSFDRPWNATNEEDVR